MKKILLVLVAIVVGACGGDRQAVPRPAPAAPPTVVDASPVQTELEPGEPDAAVPVECIANDEQKAACLAEGEHFRYGKRPEAKSCVKFDGPLYPSPPKPGPVKPFPCVCMMNESCVYSAAGAKACQQRGAGFSYGPSVIIRCQGTAPRPGEMQCLHESTRRSSCSCNDMAALAQRRQRCSRIP